MPARLKARSAEPAHLQAAAAFSKQMPIKVSYRAWLNATEPMASLLAIPPVMVTGRMSLAGEVASPATTYTRAFLTQMHLNLSEESAPPATIKILQT
jgi:hypothetical protein